MSQLKELFEKISQFGNPTILGVDIGASAVKVCELVKGKKGKYILNNFGFSPVREGSILEEEIESREEVVKSIHQAIKLSKSSIKSVCYGLSPAVSVVKKMKAPEGSDDEIRDHVTWESEQYVPFGIDNANIDVHLLEKNNKDANRDVILAAAKVESCQEVEDIFKEAGYQVKKIDLQFIALINIFEHSYRDQLREYSKGTLIIDFGAQSTKIVVYKEGAPLLAKSLDIGGISVTEEIQKEIGLSYSEAEDLKFIKDPNGNYPEDVLEAVKKVVTKIVASVNDTITFFNNPNAQDKIFYCLITGGSAQLPGILEGLSQIVDVPIEILDPFKNIELRTKNQNEDYMNQISYVGSVALGLALRSFD